MHASIPAPRRRFTVDEIGRMLDGGILTEDDPVELLDGELVAVSPQGPMHGTLVQDIAQLLAARYPPERFRLRTQLPLQVDAHSLPEPDLAVGPLGWRGRYDAHPRADEALLVVEIAVSSLALDRAKGTLYARGGAPTYWLIDVPARRLEVRTGPTAEGSWRVVTSLDETGSVALPGLDETLGVASLLP